MKWDIALCMVILLTTALLLTAGVQADDSNEKEFGGWSVDKYHGHGNDLGGDAAANVDQFCERMKWGGWTQERRWKDDYAWESDFEDSTRGGFDNYEADSVDLVYFCGHGNEYGIAFGTLHDRVPGGSDYFAENVEIKWGDSDMEWIVLDACLVLRHTSDNKWWQRWDNPTGYPNSSALTIHAGLHVMMGWHSISKLYDCWKSGWKSRGGWFADEVRTGQNVWTAWHVATTSTKPWWDHNTYRAAMGYGKIYDSNNNEVLRYSNEHFYNPWKDPTWYVNHGYTLKRGYSSWNV